VLDLDTVACLRAVHDIRLSPRKTAKPPVELLSSTHPAQLASEKSLTIMDLDLQIFNPNFTVPLIYRNILFIALQ
jgi:hypothetical protein